MKKAVFSIFSVLVVIFFMVGFDTNLIEIYNMIEEYLEEKNLITLLVGAMLSGIVTLFLVFSFRPKIGIDSVSIVEGLFRLKIKVNNLRYFSNANNVQLEAAFVNNQEQTFHIECERSSFLTIPNKSHRVFQSNDFEFFTKYLSHYKSLHEFLHSNKNATSYIFRVRVHAEHSFTGFGRSFEQEFIFKNGVFFKSRKYLRNLLS